jgi:hypothetical protein
VALTNVADANGGRLSAMLQRAALLAGVIAAFAPARRPR